MKSIIVSDLTCEYRSEALGIDVSRPRFSWKLLSTKRAITQKAYQIVVRTSTDELVWDTGYVESDQSIQVPYEGLELQSRTRYYYKVKVWDNYNNESEWSYEAWFETAFYNEKEWQASWITPDSNEESYGSYLLRKEFILDQDINSARLYVSGLGMYELSINGEPITEDLYLPGWTSYHHRIQYQTYDITTFLKQGANAVGAFLGDGWYRSGMGYGNKNYKYGLQRALLVQMHISYSDGSERVITSDSFWKAAKGPILASSIYHGEVFDARLELDGWNMPHYNDDDWKSVNRYEHSFNKLLAQENSPNRITEKLKPIDYFISPSGQQVLDFGQNLVGRISMTVNVKPGEKIIIKHSEVLDKEGNVYFANLRDAQAKIEYIARGTQDESYAPHFTFMGFRYIVVEGYPGNTLPMDSFIVEVIHTDMEPTGEFECSDDRINQLQSNILWGQRGNFLDVPTDCPQRDERLGWTGDAQVFIDTALYNFQGAPFFTKWLRDLKAEQHPDGGVPFVIPDVIGDANSSAWGDAAVICPWTVYQYYGDVQLLSEQYESMKRWVEYIRMQGDNEYLWNTGFHFGDWLALDAKEDSYIGATPVEFIATAYYAYSTQLVTDAANVLEKQEDYNLYSELHQKIIRAFQDQFVTPSGKIAVRTQTAHVLALMFDLVSSNQKAGVAADLVELIVENDYHLSTGFVGTPHICFALSNHGYHNVAMKLLMQDTFPGWLYSVSKGATTIWEHWDSIKPDGSFWSDDMNSFNHYAYGAVGNWMYRKIAGLDMSSEHPAFKRIRIEPLYGDRYLSYARTAHQSLYGRISCGWSIEENVIKLDVNIPANTTADVYLHGAKLEDVRESNHSLQVIEGILGVTSDQDGVTITIGSGEYQFQYVNHALDGNKYTMETRMKELLLDEEARVILRKYMPNIFIGLGTMFLERTKLKDLPKNQLTKINDEQVRDMLNELVKTQ